MPLQLITVPEDISRRPIDDDASLLIDTANDAIEAFMLSDESVIENFVTCDFHLVEQTIDWIQQEHLCTGDRFCELGAGFGVIAMLAARRNFESIGIEIEPRLVDEASALSEQLQNAAVIHGGSFVPRGVVGLAQVANEVRNVDTTEEDLWDDIGWEIEDVDLFFAFPWPGENGFIETILEAKASVGALLLTYQGREGIRLMRKV